MIQDHVFEIIKVGQMVHIENGRSRSRPFGVYNILNRELILCQALDKKSSSVNFNPLDEVTIVVPDQSEGAYLVKAMVDEIDKSRGIAILKPRDDVNITQRRQCRRISKPSGLVRYQLISDGIEDNALFDGKIWDLSESGIGVLVKAVKIIHPGSHIKLSILISNEKPIEIVGEIVRVVPKNVVNNEYLLGIRFVEVSRNDSSRIARYITQEELARRHYNYIKHSANI